MIHSKIIDKRNFGVPDPQILQILYWRFYGVIQFPGKNFSLQILYSKVILKKVSQSSLDHTYFVSKVLWCEAIENKIRKIVQRDFLIAHSLFACDLEVRLPSLVPTRTTTILDVFVMLSIPYDLLIIPGNRAFLWIINIWNIFPGIIC